MSLRAQVSYLSDAFLDLLFPVKCVGCGLGGELICRSCQVTLPRITVPYCLSCGSPLKSSSTCMQCQKQTMHTDGIRSLFVHKNLVRDAVQALKYNNLKLMAKTLAGFMAEYLSANIVPVEVLVPVPIHSKRIRQRGYNQSALLAKELGRRASLPVSEGSLERVVNTPSQVSLGAEARRDNVYGAFHCVDKELTGKCVLLIDDVCTTGATLDACAMAVRGIHPASVWGLTVSRELKNFQED